MVSGLVCCGRELGSGDGVGGETVTSSLVLTCPNTIVINISIETSLRQVDFNWNWPFFMFWASSSSTSRNFLFYIYALYSHFAKRTKKEVITHFVIYWMTGPALDSLENQNTPAFLFSVLFKTQYCGWSMMPSGAHIMTGNIATHIDMGYFFLFISISITLDVGLYCGRWGGPGQDKVTLRQVKSHKDKQMAI